MTKAKTPSFLDNEIVGGIVIAVAEDVKEVVLGLNVLFDGLCGVTIVIGNAKYRLVARNDIYATITKVS